MLGQICESDAPLLNSYQERINREFTRCSNEYGCEGCRNIPCGDGKGICTLVENAHCRLAHVCCLHLHAKSCDECDHRTSEIILSDFAKLKDRLK